VRFSRRLRDQPLGTAAHRDVRALAEQVPRAFPRAREHAHVCVQHQMPVHTGGEQAGGEPPQRRERLDVLHRVRLLRVAQRHAGDAMLHEKQRFQHADRDQHGRRAELPEQAAAEGLQVRGPPLGAAFAGEQLCGLGPAGHGLGQ
jgi:hypothetical protein